MRYKIYVKDVLSTDSGLCVAIAILNGKDTQICLPISLFGTEDGFY